ncbi:MAG: hypothetical protein PVH19_04200 [Planctomycetia bacterium]|jgi:hypothetical protein
MTKSRRNNPNTSHQAACDAKLSGWAASQRAICLTRVSSHPGQTTAEIARATKMKRHMTSRATGAAL